ncbi:MAG: guanylate kinase [Christensenellaceae bacterium]|jgi:guanylate kinase
MLKNKKQEKKQRSLLIVLSGPSGSGKGAIVEKLLEKDNTLELSVSCTTRRPRAHEKDGVNYFFKNREEFDNMVVSNAFLEHANVFDCSYGTPKDYVLKKLEEGKNVILEIDVQGAMQVKKNYENAVMIFILPPSKEELERRLRGRGTETELQIRKRIGKAESEMEMAKEYGHCVVNDDLDAAVDEVLQIIEKEKNYSF